MVREFEAKNEWALILGGSSGLGLATAKKLAAHGLNVFIVHRNVRAEMPTVELEFADIISKRVQCVAVNKDLNREEHQAQIMSVLKKNLGKEGKLRVLVHSVAKGNLKAMNVHAEHTLDARDMQITWENMALSLMTWVQKLQTEKCFARNASIIAFTSEGNTKVIDNYGAVSLAKASLEAIVRQLAVELAPQGIRANCIQAGVTDTRSLRMIPGSDKLIAIAKQRNPSGRLTRAEDVANAVYLLCKEEASWINGVVLKVDGGEHLR